MPKEIERKFLVSDERWRDDKREIPVKSRHHIDFGGFETPAWLGREVTGDEKFRQINLIKARKRKLAKTQRLQTAAQ